MRLLTRRPVRPALLALGAVLACLLPPAAGGAGAAPADPSAPGPPAASGPALRVVPAAPRKVVVGVYVNQVKSVSIIDNEFVVDFWLWFRWKGADYKPLERFEIIGGIVENKMGEQTRALPSGETHAAIRVFARIKKYFDLRHFPLDDHVLRIEVEDNENEDHLVLFVADAVNSQLDPGVRTPGWTAVASRSLVVQHTYATNYGDTSLPTGDKSSYSRFVFEIDLDRPGLGYLLKLFWTIYVSVMIAFVALLIRPTDLDPRFGLGVGAIFAAAASAYVVNSALPPTNILTLSDKVNMISVGFILLSLLESIVSLRFCYREMPEVARRLDRICFWALLGSYVLANVIAVTTG